MNDKDKTPTPIDVSAIDLEDLKKRTTDIPGLLEYAHSVGGFSVIPTKQGTIKATAMRVMQEQTQMQLDMLLEQMKLLAKQAQSLKDRAELSEKIYEADLAFKPIIGETYYIYEKNGKNVLSIIAPEEWGRSKTIGAFVAEALLLADHTWKIIRQA
ncbi:DUF2452 domain-containing protein [Bacteriovoracaceae bacterium]|nr:DUF2452 domain-containing protein [Bacteriovoracaceae bacterium]